MLFLYHRVSRIYPLYWVYTTLALLVIPRPAFMGNNSQGNQVDIAASYLLLPTGLLPLVQVGWTLIHEMYFYLVFFIILAFVPEKFLAWALLLWAAGIGISGFPMSSPLTKRWFFNPLTFEFIAGCLLAVHYHESPPLKVGGKTLAAAAVLGLVSAAFGFVRYNQSTGLMPVNLAETLLYGIPAVVIVFCITHAEQNKVLLPGFLVQGECVVLGLPLALIHGKCSWKGLGAFCHRFPPR
ncbi:MAG: acyltransferase [Anaerolineales bacterium]|nr:acyltransferase [Anaerolineales bacterium]